MDRNTTLALVLCFLIFIGWQKFVLDHSPQVQTQSQSNAPTQADPQPGTKALNPVSDALRQATAPTLTRQAQTSKPLALNSSIQELKLETQTGEVVLSNTRSFLSNWSLKQYRQGLGQETSLVTLQSVTFQSDALSLAFDNPLFTYLNEVRGKLSTIPGGAVWSYEDEKVRLIRTFTVSEKKPFIDLKISMDFKGERPHYAFLSLVSQEAENDSEAQDRQFVYWSQKKIERVQLRKSLPIQEITTPIQYIGTSSRYFILALLDQSTYQPKGLIQPLPQEKGGINLVYSIQDQTLSIPLRVYFGPKDLDLLRQVDPTLDHTVDFGWFTVFAYPLLKLLKWFYPWVQNYGISIILLTLLLKILTYPLTYKSMKSMKKIAALQPQLQKMREKYKNDKEALNRETLSLMKTQGYNPMAGCLPMLIQMPIFFALYRVLYSSIELYHAPFLFWIKDLSTRDPYYVTPILLSVTMFIQQKITPQTGTDPNQAKIMQWMPLLFGAFMITVPSGLTLYMWVNAMASIFQQMILNKKFNASFS